MPQETQDVTLARIDERVKAVQKDLIDMSAQMKHVYVTKDEFKPIQHTFYALITITVTAIATTAGLLYKKLGGG